MVPQRSQCLSTTLFCNGGTLSSGIKNKGQEVGSSEVIDRLLTLELCLILCRRKGLCPSLTTHAVSESLTDGFECW